MHRLSLFALLFFMTFSASIAQWVPCNGPEGGWGFSILVDQNHIYAGSGKGVYLSTDNGETWTIRSKGIPRAWVQDLLKFDTEVFAATTEGLFKTSDAGETWDDVSISTNAGVTSLLGVQKGIYCGTGSGVYYSTDHGENWSPRNTGLASKDVRNLSQAGSYLFAALRDSGIFRSSDGGMNWEKANTGITTRQYQHLYARGDTVYTATAGPTYYSTDFGENWIDIDSTNDSITYATHIFSCGETLFIASWTGVFASTDNGATWSLRTNGLHNWRVQCLACDEEHLYAGTNSGGIYRSGDMGLNWTVGVKGYADVRTDQFLNIGNRTYTVPGNGLQYTTDHGDTWNHPSGILDTLRPRTIFQSDGTFWAATLSELYRSDDTGVSWQHISSTTLPLNCQNYTVIGDVLFGINETGKLYRSEDKGATWAQIADEYPDVQFTALYSDEVLLFAGTYGKGIFTSTDHGDSWIVADTGTPTRFYRDFVRRGTTCVAVGRNHLGGSVLRSTDFGVNWHVVDGPDFYGNDFQSAIAVQQGFIIGGTSGQLYISTDDGQTWKDIYANLPYNHVRALILSGEYVMVSLQDIGVWRRPFEDILRSTKVTDLAESATLFQLYPNPVTVGQTVNIAYSLDGTSTTTIRLHDLLGRNVREVHARGMGSGNHSQQISTAGMKPGIYFYSVHASNATIQTGKLVIM